MFAQRKADELQSLLAPIRKRLSERLLIRQLVLFALYGTGGSMLLLLLARFLPIPYYRWIALALPLVSLLAGALMLIGKQPSWRQSAQAADDQGLMQRTVTAWEHRDSTAAIAVRQREDAIRHLRRQLPQIVASVRIWAEVKRQALLTGGLVLASAFLLLLPNPQDERLALIAQEQQALEEALQKVEEAEKQVADDPSLSEEQKKQLEEMLEKAKAALAEADDAKDRLQALSLAEKQLEKWKEAEERKQAALARLQQDLAQSPGTQSLGQALERGDREALAAALQEAAQAMESLTAEEREQLAGELKKAEERLRQEAEAAQSEEAEKIADELAAAAQQMAQGQIPQALGALEQSLLQAMAMSAQTQQALLAAANTAASLQQSQMTLASAAGASGNNAAAGTPGTASAGQAVPGSGTPGQGSPNGQQGSGNQSGTPGAGNQPGNSNGGGQGNGSGQGSGSGSGNGSGSGSGNGAGSGSGSGGGQGSGAGLGEGSHELVTVPSQRLGDASGPTDTVSGPLGAGPSQSQTSANSQVSAGGTLPYEEVYAQYEQFARESLTKGSIPSDYQEVVKEYFESIEPQ
jgi:hypothetical protein